MKYNSVEEWKAEATRRFGPDMLKWRFRCPMCGHVASVQDFKDAGAKSPSCSRYNVPKDMFRFDRLPEGFSTMDARSVRNELSKIRDVANEISSDMAKALDKSMKPKERRDEAR